MAQKKPRDPITEYRKRNLKEQIRRSRKAPDSATNNNQNLAKIIVIVFIVVIMILVYMLGFFSG